MQKIKAEVIIAISGRYGPYGPYNENWIRGAKAKWIGKSLLGHERTWGSY